MNIHSSHLDLSYDHSKTGLLSQIARQSINEPEMYLVKISDDELAPRYERGEYIHVQSKEPVSLGCHVLILTRPKPGPSPQAPVIGQWVETSGRDLTLQRYKSREKLTVRFRDILAMYRVTGCSVVD